MPHYNPRLKPARWSWRKAVAFIIVTGVFLWAVVVSAVIYIATP